MTARQIWISRKKAAPPMARRDGERVFRIRCNTFAGERIVSIRAFNREDAFQRARKLGNHPIAIA